MRWRRAMITGATSGIGESIARELAQRGIELVLTGRDEAAMMRIHEDLAQQVAAEAIVGDLTRESDIARLENRLASTKNPIDLLVNCAGYTVNGRFAEKDVGPLLDLISVNVWALVRLCHSATQQMIPRRTGAILNISSKAAFRPLPGVATYSAAKAFVNVFSRTLALELAPYGIAVTCVCPGPTETRFLERAGLDASGYTGMADPDDVARAALTSAEAGDLMTIVGSSNADDIADSLLADLESIVVREETSPRNARKMPPPSRRS